MCVFGFISQDYLVNILLETATKEYCEGARYVILDHIVFICSDFNGDFNAFV